MARLSPFHYDEYSEYGYLGTAPTKKLQQFMIVENKVIENKFIVVHTFIMGDVEDPDLYAAEPIWQWQQTEMGKWVMENAVQEPMWQRQIDPGTYGYRYVIIASLKAEDITFWTLKWGNKVQR